MGGRSQRRQGIKTDNKVSSTSFERLFITLKPRHVGPLFTDRNFQMHFFWMNIYKFWLKFHEVCSKSPINNTPALVQIMAWCRPGDKPFSEPMIVSLLTHATRPQWDIVGVFESAFRYVDVIWAPLCLKSNTLQWRHNDYDSVSNHQPHDCLLGRLFRHRSKKTSKLRVTGLCAGNSSVTGEFPAQMASNAENVSFWRRPHEERKHKSYG